MQIQRGLNTFDKDLLKDVDLKIKLNRNWDPLFSETDFPDLNGNCSKEKVTRLVQRFLRMGECPVSEAAKAAHALPLLPSLWRERVRADGTAGRGLSLCHTLGEATGRVSGAGAASLVPSHWPAQHLLPSALSRRAVVPPPRFSLQFDVSSAFPALPNVFPVCSVGNFNRGEHQWTQM